MKQIEKFAWRRRKEVNRAAVCIADHGRSAWLRLIAALSLSIGLAGAASAQKTSSATPLQVLQQAHWIAEGSDRPQHVLYIFIDANCPFCHKLWLALEPYGRQQLQVRDLLVGVIGPSSPGKAAAILDARDPAGALRINELKWGSRTDGGGGIGPVAQPSHADTEILAHNLALMQAIGFQGTPGLVYADARGRLHAIDGSPNKDQLAEIIHSAAVPGP